MYVYIIFVLFFFSNSVLCIDIFAYHDCMILWLYAYKCILRSQSTKTHKIYFGGDMTHWCFFVLFFYVYGMPMLLHFSQFPNVFQNFYIRFYTFCWFQLPIEIIQMHWFCVSTYLAAEIIIVIHFKQQNMYSNVFKPIHIHIIHIHPLNNETKKILFVSFEHFLQITAVIVGHTPFSFHLSFTEKRKCDFQCEVNLPKMREIKTCNKNVHLHGYLHIFSWAKLE